MTIVWSPPDSPAHICQPPMRDVKVHRPRHPGESVADYQKVKGTVIGTEPDANEGTIWLCPCGKMWTVRYDSGIRKHGYTPSRHYWSSATWLERIKARRAAR